MPDTPQTQSQNQPQPPKLPEDPINEIAILTEQLRQQNSLFRRFLIGVAGGIGTAIGATIVASLLVLLLSQFIRTVYDIPVIGNLLETSEVNSLIEFNKSQQEYRDLISP